MTRTDHRPRAADPRLKLATALAALGLILSLPRAAPALALAGVVLAALLIGVRAGNTRSGQGELSDGGWPERGPAIPWRSLLAAWVLGTFAALLRLLLTPGPMAVRWPLLGHSLELSRPGLEQGALILSRVLAATLTGAWLTATTPFTELVAALGWMKVPAPFLEILLLAQRYRCALADSLDTVRCAQAMRLGHEGWHRRFASTGALLGAVACRALDQAGATAEAMQLRGDRGLAAVALPSRHPPADALLAGCAFLALAGCASLAWGMPW